MKGLKKVSLLSLLSLLGFFSADVSAQKKRLRSDAAEKVPSFDEGEEVREEAAASAGAGVATCKKVRGDFVCTEQGCNARFRTQQGLDRHAQIAHQPLQDGDDAEDEDNSDNEYGEELYPYAAATSSRAAAGGGSISSDGFVASSAAGPAAIERVSSSFIRSALEDCNVTVQTKDRIEGHISVLPLECLDLCASFLDSDSRKALGESSSRMSKQLTTGVRFKENASREVILSKLTRCPHLKKLDLVNCYGQLGFIERLPEDIEFQLEELNLYNTGATAEQVSAIIQRCPRLKKLNLWQCPGSAGFIEGLPEGFGAQLEELNLSDTGATADQVRAIVQRCRKLKKLKLAGCKGGAGPIAELSAEFGLLLEELDLEDTRVTAEQVSGIVQRCPKLKKLNLRGCNETARAIVELPAGFGEQLEELDLSNASVTHDQVRAIVQRCPQLKKLSLRGCSGAARAIVELPDGVGEQLEELVLGETSATPDQVRAIVQRCSHLKKLDLDHCLGAAAFIEGLPAGFGGQLEELVLASTSATAAHVKAIVQQCPQLKKLDLFGCRGSEGFIEGLPPGAGAQLEELFFSPLFLGQIEAIQARFPGCKIWV